MPEVLGPTHPFQSWRASSALIPGDKTVNKIHQVPDVLADSRQTNVLTCQGVINVIEKKIKPGKRLERATCMGERCVWGVYVCACVGVCLWLDREVQVGR